MGAERPCGRELMASGRGPGGGLRFGMGGLTGAASSQAAPAASLLGRAGGPPEEKRDGDVTTAYQGDMAPSPRSPAHLSRGGVRAGPGFQP